MKHENKLVDFKLTFKPRPHCATVCQFARPTRHKASWLRWRFTASTQEMTSSRKMYTNEDLVVAAAAVIIVESETKAIWDQSARLHYQLSSEMARLSLKRTDTSRVRVGKPVGTILPTGMGQWTRLHQFWQCHLALPTGIQRHSVDAAWHIGV